MRIRKLRQVFIACANPEQRASFYADALGLRLQFRDGDRWVQFTSGDVSIALAGREESMGAPLDVPVPVFEVDDLGAAIDELRQKGHQAGEVRDMGAHGRTAAIRDPSGAFLVLFQKD